MGTLQTDTFYLKNILLLSRIRQFYVRAAQLRAGLPCNDGMENEQTSACDVRAEMLCLNLNCFLSFLFKGQQCWELLRPC